MNGAEPLQPRNAPPSPRQAQGCDATEITPDSDRRTTGGDKGGDQRRDDLRAKDVAE